MIQTATLVLLWSAAAYRVCVTMRSPNVLWRSTFTAAMVSVPLAATVHFYRADVGRILGQPNVGGLITHAVFALGAASVNVYLEALQHELPRRRIVRFHFAVGLAIAALMIGTWLVSPIHQVEYVDLSVESVYLSVAAYHVLFYGYMSLSLLNIIRFCAAETWSAPRSAAPARALSLVLIGVACISGLPVMILFGVNVAIPVFDPGSDGSIGRVGSAILPWPLMLLAIGVLSLLTVPWCAEVLTMRRRWVALRPLWQDLTARHPEVHLSIAEDRVHLRDRLRIREQRVITEIHDALRREMVPVGALMGPEVLAGALRRREHGGAAATEALSRTHDRDEDLGGLLTLGRAYNRADVDRVPTVV